MLPLIKYFKVIANKLETFSSNLEIFIPTLPHLKARLIHLTKNWKKKPGSGSNIQVGVARNSLPNQTDCEAAHTYYYLRPYYGCLFRRINLYSVLY